MWRINSKQFSPVEPAAPSPNKRVPFLYLSLLLYCLSALSNNDVLASIREIDEKISALHYKRLQNQLSQAQTAVQNTATVQLYLQLPADFVAHNVRLSFEYGGVQQHIPLQASTTFAHWFMAELPVLDAGEYAGLIQLQHTISQDIEKLIQWPVKLTIGSGQQVIQWQLQPALIGSDKLLTRYWGAYPKTWPKMLLDLFWPDRVQYQAFNENISSRPDYQFALKACAAGDFKALVDMILMLKQLPVQSEQGEDLLACALNTRQRRFAHALIELWREQQALSPRAEKLALDLAQTELAYQQLDRADSLLIRRVAGEFSGQNNARWRDLSSRLLMRQGELQAALEMLARGPHLQAEDALIGDSEQQLLYQAMRLNLAAALNQSGAQLASISLLDEIGQVTPASELVAALRDQANILLGWHFLEIGQGLTAQAAFNRVQLQGDAASVALLGRGYALAGEAGQVQARGTTVAKNTSTLNGESMAALKAKFKHGFISCEQFRDASGDNTVCARPQAFSVVDTDLDERQRRNKALQTWLHLIQLDLPDLASQEARLRAATLLQKQQRYDEALVLLESALQLLEQQDTARAQERDWLDSNMTLLLTAQPDDGRFWHSLEWTALSKAWLAKWLARADVQALMKLQQQAKTLERSDLAAGVMQLLQASLIHALEQHWQQLQRMEPEIRMRLAHIHHEQVLQN